MSTKETNYIQFYNPSDSKDAIFIRPNYDSKKVSNEKLEYTNKIKLLQIKVTRNDRYLKNTIDNMIIGKYNGVVLTCLEYSDGIHTKDRCIT